MDGEGGSNARKSTIDYSATHLPGPDGSVGGAGIDYGIDPTARGLTEGRSGIVTRIAAESVTSDAVESAPTGVMGGIVGGETGAIQATLRTTESGTAVVGGMIVKSENGGLDRSESGS